MNKKYIFTFAVLMVLFMGVVSTYNASAIAIGPFAGPPPHIIQNLNSTNATAQSNSTNATAQSRIVPVVSAQFTTSSTNSSNQVLISSGVSAGGANGTCVTQNNCFDPHVVNVTTGQKVTWNNTDTTIHTVTSGKPSDSNMGKLFDKSISPGKSVSITFKKTGTVNYFCKIHPWMTGQVIVEDTHSHSSAQNTSNSTSAQNVTNSNETNSNSSNVHVTTSSSNQTHS